MTEQPIFDWQKCLTVCNNNPKIAKEILHDFAIELPIMIQKINELYQLQKFKELALMLHQLHGSCSYCAVPRLQNAVYALERNGIQKNNLDQQLALLNHEAELVLLTLNELFDEAHTPKL